MKKFLLNGDQIKHLLPSIGRCLATDEITVIGRSVGYMYREEPDDKGDSGWRFFAGDESEDYVNDSQHIEIYDVNTIANYDPDIIPFLNSPIGSAFARGDQTGELTELHN